MGADMFLYIFLPPLLLDAAVRLDWWIFRKVLAQVGTYRETESHCAGIRVRVLSRSSCISLHARFDARHCGLRHESRWPGCSASAGIRTGVALDSCSVRASPEVMCSIAARLTQVLTFAVGVVIGMVVLMAPLLLYAFDLSTEGWCVWPLAPWHSSLEVCEL